MKTQKKLMVMLPLFFGLFLIPGCGGNQREKGKQTLKIGIIVPLTRVACLGGKLWLMCGIPKPCLKKDCK